VILVTAAIALTGTTFAIRLMHDSHFPKPIRGFAVDPKPIGQVKLTDKLGHVLNADRFKGKWTMLFFGYTNCPDVCPSTLLQLKQLKKTLVKNPQTRNFQFLFISVDPQRDTQKRLKEYVDYFDADFHAATGDIKQIIRFEHVFGAFHKYEKKSKDDIHYSVAHSAEVYIVDPQQMYVGKFLPPIDVNKLTHKLTALSDFVLKQGPSA
jgi:protein SCO1/2